MGCNNPDGSPCLGGDGSSCLGPDIIEACHLEPLCDGGIPEVPYITTSPGATTVSILWTGMNLGDDLEFFIKDSVSNTILLIGTTTDVALGELGESIESLTLGAGEYILAMRRIQGNYSSPWSIYRTTYDGTLIDIIVDDTDFIVDGVFETSIIDNV